ncbi:hypothetical protein ACFU8I_00075 [Streptomyces sp. NPDC057540]|uniref:hypothetical protein n=1 Tax=Streptomyces sp. NPDC057540 TaxID=3346160 RepID=UPI003685FD21
MIASAAPARLLGDPGRAVGTCAIGAAPDGRCRLAATGGERHRTGKADAAAGLADHDGSWRGFHIVHVRPAFRDLGSQTAVAE